MAVPTHSQWGDDMHGPRDLWSLDYGDSRTVDSTPLTNPNASIRNPADTPKYISEWNVFTQTPDYLLSPLSAMQPIEPKADWDFGLGHPTLPLSSSMTGPRETDFATGFIRQGTITSLKEQVQAMAKADLRQIPVQEKRRDAFIEIRREQLDAEDVGAVNITAPNPFYGAKQSDPSQQFSLSRTQIGNRSSAFSSVTGRNLQPSTVDSEIDEAHISTGLDPSNFRFASRSNFAPGTSRLELQGSPNSHSTTARRRKGVSVQALTEDHLSGKSPCPEMVWNHNMNPLAQRPKRPRTKEERDSRLAVRRHGGACSRHKASKKACRCKLSEYRSESFRTPSTSALFVKPHSTPSRPSAELEDVSSHNSTPRHFVSRSLLRVIKSPDMASPPIRLLDQHLPDILKAAAELLASDDELSTTDMWLPVLRVADTIFRSTTALISHIETSTITTSSKQFFYNNLFNVISLICDVLSEDCQTLSEIWRFLARLMEAANDLSMYLSIAGANEDTERAKTNTLKLWLETIRSELQTVCSLLPEDTLVFTCPFPLAGCTYQTTDMEQWKLHKDKCRGLRLASRRLEPVRKKTNKELEAYHTTRALTISAVTIALCERPSALLKQFLQDHMKSTVQIRPALRKKTRVLLDEVSCWLPPVEIDFGVLASKFASKFPWHKDLALSPHFPPIWDNRGLFEAICRVVWLELLRMFGLCMLSVMPMRTNTLGFVVCWLTILRSVSMWKCEGRSLLIV